VEGGVESAPGPGALNHLESAGLRVATEEQIRLTRQVSSLGGFAIGQGDFGARGDVAAGLDNAVVSQRDADAGVRADQTPGADADDLFAAPGERAHDRCTTADVRAISNDDSSADASFDHRRSERPGIEVDESLVHDDGSFSHVGSEPHAVSVGDPNPARNHVIHHAGEAVHAEHRDVNAFRASAQMHVGESFRGDRSEVRPGVQWQFAEDAV